MTYEEALANYNYKYLTDREKKIIGLRLKDNLDLDTIGRLYGVTRERVRQIESKAMRKLMREEKPSLSEMFHGNRRSLILYPNGDISVIDIFSGVSLYHKTYNPGEYLQDNLSEAYKAYLGDSEPVGDKAKTIFDMPLEELGLSVRSLNCLRRGLWVWKDGERAHVEIKTIGELVERTEEEMMKVRNLGKKSLKEVKEKLAEYGLHFRGYED